LRVAVAVGEDVADDAVEARIVRGDGTVEVDAERLADVGGVVPGGDFGLRGELQAEEGGFAQVNGDDGGAIEDHGSDSGSNLERP
jgi:hypothetical protein